MSGQPEKSQFTAERSVWKRELLLEEFEQAWQSGRPPSIHELLRKHGAVDRDQMLAALSQIDLESRLRRGLAARVEDYLAQFPELSSKQDVVLELVETEFHARQRYGPFVDVAEIVSRFPQMSDSVHKRLNDLQESDVGDTISPADMEKGATPSVSLNARPKGGSASRERQGNYEFLEEIGRGGMGVVYRVRDTRLDRIVALKMLRGGDLASDEERQRFDSEAKSAARLRHPGIVTVYDVGEFEGQPYFCMEYVDGIDLESLTEKETIPPRRAASYIKSIAEAMQHAHEQGVVHRDLKPSNVVLARRSRGPKSSDPATHRAEDEYEPRVTDFGLARRVETSGNRTISGQILGTPSYMPPEQAAGRTQDLGPLVDIYAIGATLYHVLTGRPPFKSHGAYETLRAVMELSPVAPRLLNPGIPADLETICLKCLSKVPTDRYPTAQAVADDLDRFLKGEPILARPLGLPTRALRWMKRHKQATALLGTSILLFVLVGLTVILGMYISRRNEISEQLTIINSMLDDPQWSFDFTSELENRLIQLDQLDPAEGKAARESLFGTEEDLAQEGRIVEILREQISQPKLAADQAADLRSTIGRIAKYNQAASADLERSLDLRLVRWQEVLSLSSPSDDWAAGLVACAAEIKIDQGQAARVTPDDTKRIPILTGQGADQQVDVEFRGYLHSTAFGITLGQTAAKKPGPAYELYVVVKQPPGANGELQTFAAALENNLKIRLVLRRNGIVVREQEFPATQISGDTVTLKLRHEATRLIWRFQEEPEQSIDEIFQLIGANGGNVSLYWPTRAVLNSIKITRPIVPPSATPLEQGDLLFAQGDFEQSARFFEKHIAESSDEGTRREARYKHAVSLYYANNPQEARREFEAILKEEALLSPPEQRWYLPTVCQLWMLNVQEDRMAEADLFIDDMGARFDFTQLSLLLPVDVRKKIIDAYKREMGLNGYYAILDLPKKIRQLERADRILSLMGARGAELINVKFKLGEAYLIAEDFQSLEKLLADSRDFARTDDERANFDTMEMWLLLQKQGPDQAIEFLNSRMFDAEGKLKKGFGGYWVTRAAIYARQQDWQKAEQELQTYLARSETDRDNFADLDAWLLYGFVRKRLGDPDKGRPQWEQGFDRARQIKAYNFIGFSLLGSLSGKISLEDMDPILASMPVIEGSMGNLMVRTGQIPPEFIIALIRNMWRGRRGLDVAERIATYRLSYADALAIQGPIGAHEVFRQAVLGASSPDEPYASELPNQLPEYLDVLIWNAVTDFDQQLRAGKQSEIQLVCLFKSYLPGAMNFLGWGGIADRLTPSIRGPVAFAFGCRQVELNHPEDARTLFNQAIEDAEVMAKEGNPLADALRQEAEKRRGTLPVIGTP